MRKNKQMFFKFIQYIGLLIIFFNSLPINALSMNNNKADKDILPTSISYTSDKKTAVISFKTKSISSQLTVEEISVLESGQDILIYNREKDPKEDVIYKATRNGPFLFSVKVKDTDGVIKTCEQTVEITDLKNEEGTESTESTEDTESTESTESTEETSAKEDDLEEVEAPSEEENDEKTLENLEDEQIVSQDNVETKANFNPFDDYRWTRVYKNQVGELKLPNGETLLYTFNGRNEVGNKVEELYIDKPNVVYRNSKNEVITHIYDLSLPDGGLSMRNGFALQDNQQFVDTLNIDNNKNQLFRAKNSANQSVFKSIAEGTIKDLDGIERRIKVETLLEPSKDGLRVVHQTRVTNLSTKSFKFAYLRLFMTNLNYQVEDTSFYLTDITSLGDKRGVYMTSNKNNSIKPPFRIDYRFDVENGPNNWVGESAVPYTRWMFLESYRFKLWGQGKEGYGKDSILKLGENTDGTALNMKWYPETLFSNQSRIFNYEVGISPLDIPRPYIKSEIKNENELQIGDRIDYTIELTNEGYGDWKNIKIEDILPKEIEDIKNIKLIDSNNKEHILDPKNVYDENEHKISLEYNELKKDKKIKIEFQGEISLEAAGKKITNSIKATGQDTKGHEYRAEENKVIKILKIDNTKTHLESKILSENSKDHWISGEVITIQHKMYSETTNIIGIKLKERLILKKNLLNGQSNEDIMPINIKIGEDPQNLEEYKDKFNEDTPIEFSYPKDKKPYYVQYDIKLPDMGNLGEIDYLKHTVALETNPRERTALEYEIWNNPSVNSKDEDKGKIQIINYDSFKGVNEEDFWKEIYVKTATTEKEMVVKGKENNNYLTSYNYYEYGSDTVTDLRQEFPTQLEDNKNYLMILTISDKKDKRLKTSFKRIITTDKNMVASSNVAITNNDSELLETQLNIIKKDKFNEKMQKLTKTKSLLIDNQTPSISQLEVTNLDEWYVNGKDYIDKGVGDYHIIFKDKSELTIQANFKVVANSWSYDTPDRTEEDGSSGYIVLPKSIELQKKDTELVGEAVIFFAKYPTSKKYTISTNRKVTLRKTNDEKNEIEVEAVVDNGKSEKDKIIVGELSEANDQNNPIKLKYTGRKEIKEKGKWTGHTSFYISQTKS